MSIAGYIDYLEPVIDELDKRYPDNRVINVVCHGHSIPAGYFATPYVDTFNAYPHLLHKTIKERFPFAVVNVIVTGKGGEHSANGAERFEPEVLRHDPDVVTINYAINDSRIGAEAAKAAWSAMIEKSLSHGVKVILITPIFTKSYFTKGESWDDIAQSAAQIRELADKYGVGLADVFERYGELVKNDGDLTAFLSHINHPTKAGHAIIAAEIAKYFLAR